MRNLIAGGEWTQGLDEELKAPGATRIVLARLGAALTKHSTAAVTAGEETKAGLDAAALKLKLKMQQEQKELQAGLGELFGPAAGKAAAAAISEEAKSHPASKKNEGEEKPRWRKLF